MILERNERDLTPHQRLMRREERRAEARRLRDREQENDARNALAEEERALLEDEEAFATHSGRRITARGRGPKTGMGSTAAQRRDRDTSPLSLIGPFSWDTLRRLSEGFNRLVSSPTPAFMAMGAGAVTAPTLSLQFEGVAYEDERYRYQTARVSKTTQEILEREIAIIRSFEQAVAESTSLESFREKNRTLLSMAEQFSMRRHPVTHEFVHSIDRVLAEESKISPLKQQSYDGLIAVFAPIALFQGDGRRITVKLGDQFDAHTVEVVASGSHHAPPPARQIAPPQFHFIR